MAIWWRRKEGREKNAGQFCRTTSKRLVGEKETARKVRCASRIINPQLIGQSVYLPAPGLLLSRYDAIGRQPLLALRAAAGYASTSVAVEEGTWKVLRLWDPQDTGGQATHTCLARRGRHVVVAASRGTPDSDGWGCKLCSHSRGGARALHCQHGPSGSGSPRLTSYPLAGWLPGSLLWISEASLSLARLLFFFLSWERTFDSLYLPAKLLSSEMAHFIFASATCDCCALSEVVKKPALTRLFYVRGWKDDCGPKSFTTTGGVFFYADASMILPNPLGLR